MSEALANRSISNREMIDALQHEVLKLPQYEPVTYHYFADGMYCREVIREAGTLVIGAVHKKEHFYIVASGTVSITDGMSAAKQVIGPAVHVSQPGTKRAVYAHTASVCMTVHRTDKTTIEDIEAELVESDPASSYLTGNILKTPLIEDSA
jgi:hypothetical protein